MQAQNFADVGMTAADCRHFSNTGPPMTVYPAGAWQQPTSTEDIDQNVQTHQLAGDGIGQRLTVILKR